MASKMRKFSASLDIDGNLCAEGAESELSLADDADEFSESFSGKLSLIADDSSQHTSDESEIRENDSDIGLESEMPEVGVVESPITTSLANHRVTFEIVNAKIVKEGRSRYVVYSILIVRAGSVESSQATVDRRYSDFNELNNSLRKKFLGLMSDIAFPKKVVTGNFKPETIAQRSRAFEQYLSHIYTIDILRLSTEFAEFFYKKDLKDAYELLANGQFSEALPILKTAMHLQQRLLGEGHEEVIKTQCALVAACCETGQMILAQGFSEIALQCIGKDDHNDYLPSLLQLSIRLCWKLGKDKVDLESRQAALKERGLDVDSPPPLLKLVLENR